MTLCGTFHNHTCFGDGADTPQRMVEAAARAGFQFFGLSEHAPAPLDPAGGMRMADLPRYIDCACIEKTILRKSPGVAWVGTGYRQSAAGLYGV